MPTTLTDFRKFFWHIVVYHSRGIRGIRCGVLLIFATTVVRKAIGKDTVGKRKLKRRKKVVVRK